MKWLLQNKNIIKRAISTPLFYGFDSLNSEAMSV